MRTSVRGAKPARLNCEALEDRVTPTLAYALSGTSLLTFDTINPTAITSTVAIAGVTGGETLVGLDARPANGQLYSLGVNATTNTLTLYTVNVSTGAATAVGTGGVTFTTDGTTLVDLPDPTTVGYGFDFNPSADRIRVVAGTVNFRLNPNAPGGEVRVDGDNTGLTTGTVTGINPDGTITGATTVNGAAYTNNRATTGSPTTLYTLDSTANTLFIQNPPNVGTQTAPVPVSVDFTAVNGFDIPEGVNAPANNAPAPAGSLAFAALTVGTTTSLYSLNLTTGAATSLGTIGTGATPISGFALATSVISFQSATVSGAEGGGGVNVVLTRTGGTVGAVSVNVAVTGGTAAAGADFPAGPYTVNFAPGQTTATLNIPFAADGITEGAETLVLTITSATPGVVGAQNTTTLTVTDTPSQFGRVFGTGSTIPAVAAIPVGGSAPVITTPYAIGTATGVRVAVGDVNNDGVLDLVTVPSAGAPLVKVFSGVNGQEIASFLAYPAAFNIPASLAVGDINNDGFDDIVLGTATSLAAVLVYSGKDNTLLTLQFPFAALPIGVNVAVGDTDADGQLDIILGTTSVVGAVVVLDGQTFAQKQLFFPFGAFPSGVSVAAGDLDGDGAAEIVVGTTSLVSAVGVFKGPALQSVLFPFAGQPNGVNVAVGDVNNDGQLDVVAGVATGVAGVAAFDGNTLTLLNTLFPFGGFGGGVFVG